MDGWAGLNVPAMSRTGVEWTLDLLIQTSRVQARLDAETHPEDHVYQKLWERLREIDPAASEVGRR
jgi:hypothetical protein